MIFYEWGARSHAERLDSPDYTDCSERRQGSSSSLSRHCRTHGLEWREPGNSLVPFTTHVVR